MNVPEQLDKLRTTCYRMAESGDAQHLNGQWRVKLHGAYWLVRTGYRLGEATFWLEAANGNTLKGSYYRGDDLLSFLLSEGANRYVKQLSKNLVKTLDT